MGCYPRSVRRKRLARAPLVTVRKINFGDVVRFGRCARRSGVEVVLCRATDVVNIKAACVRSSHFHTLPARGHAQDVTQRASHVSYCIHPSSAHDHIASRVAHSKAQAASQVEHGFGAYRALRHAPPTPKSRSTTILTYSSKETTTVAADLHSACTWRSLTTAIQTTGWLVVTGARPAFFTTPAPQDTTLHFSRHSCHASTLLPTHTFGNMGFSPFKKSDNDSEARTPTPPEYDSNSHENRLPSVAREELEGLTLYEKKCVLINREIDNNGFGRYQWYIWGLCGLGYFIDLIWAQAFGLILGPLQQELGFPGTASDYCSLSVQS